MKIMLLASSQVSIPPDKGGAIEAIVYELANFLSSENEVYVISRRSFTGSKASYIVVNSEIRKNKLAAIVEDFLYGIKCIKEVRKIKPDILHMHTTFTSFPIALFKKFLPAGTRIVYTSHSPAWTVPDNEIGIINKIFNCLEAFIVRRSDMATAVSESLRDGMIKRNVSDKSKIVTIENFTRPDVFSNKYGKKWKDERKIKGPVVLFVGKLTKTKGIPYLLRSVKEVKEKIPDVMYVLVGSLEHEQKLGYNPWMKIVEEDKIKNNVYFAGSVPVAEIPRIYSSADLFVLPSLREGMPLVVMEALSTELPIVTTKVSGTKEVVNSRCAIFVRRKDSKDIAKAVIRILSDKKLAKRMSLESKKISKKFEKNNVLKKYLDLYYAIKK
ncbi:MAG: glycosyltransferase family 4 protein [Candidatus Aenigmarchaeota archaeon]|nr:glycosyltransferase family 4 protein [Candidatus Aenigmarchaeota archaeon]